ncbi:response regulator [Aliagarivorans marinus]|uniref:response regulator n=1 Tax=Aliagarivorans marinus TaxID=561965 RepID=UPI000417C50F|nr:response regulator [Aliagarivorans marinus]
MQKILNNFDRQRSVMIVDDCPMYRTATRGMLNKLGFLSEQIKLAQNAEQARSFSEEFDFQLILFDYNLGPSTNGHQLLEELQHQGKIRNDCVLVIVTADNSSAVVRGFAELEPDGYLVKPMSFDQLKSRLFQLSNRKRLLAPLQDAFRLGQYPRVLELVEDFNGIAAEVANSAQLIKAEALTEQGQLEQAKALLRSLPKPQDQVKVQLAEAEIWRREGDYEQAIEVLKAVAKQPIYCAVVRDKMAEIEFERDNRAQALVYVSEAVELAPKNIQRRLTKVDIALANQQIKVAADSMRSMILRLPHSYQDQAILHQRFVQLCLDVALDADDNQRRRLLQRATDRYRFWRRHFPRKQYKAFELLLLARANAIRWLQDKAEANYQEYLDWQQEHAEQGSRASVWEQLELAKLLFMLGHHQQSTQQLATCEQRINRGIRNIDSVAMLSYLTYWQERLSQARLHADALYKQSLADYAEERFDVALEQALEALDVDRGNPLVVKQCLVCLNKAWPAGWGKLKANRLAVFCCELLSDKEFERDRSFDKLCSELATQLDCSELLSLMEQDSGTNDE